MSLSRRQFLAASAATGAALHTPSVHGAKKNRQYRTALIGSGWGGMNILSTAVAAERSQVVALCDVDQSQLSVAQQKLSKLTAQKPKLYHDYREMLEREKPEIVIVATPDHWHPLAMIAAVNAGAHVYVEKPICHTVGEGIAMVKAARANDRKVQVGTHRRVSPHNVWGMQFLKEGKLGKVGFIRAFVHSGGGPGQPVPDADPPEGLDWDTWCGPAPLRKFNPAIHPRGFRQFLDYANGTLGDWGIHWLDHILWLTDESYPRRVCSMGGRYVKSDNTDAPDTQSVEYQFDSFTAVWEHRRYAGNQAEKHPLGIYFYGTKGTLHIGWRNDGATFYPVGKNSQPINVPPKLHEPDSQNIPELWNDFITSIESNRKPVCDIEIGRRSTDMSLLGMLSLKLGRSISWDGLRNQIVDDPQATRLLTREYRKPWIYPT